MKKKKEIKLNLEEIKHKKVNLISKLSLIDKTKLLTNEEAAELYSKLEPKKFGPAEIILLLLGVIPDKPIKGKTMMMKQTFLSEKELNLDVQDLQFVGHRFGPHSFLMENILRNMEFFTLIEKKGAGKNPRYLLSERGKKMAEELLTKLSGEEKNKLKDFRISCDELGTDGMIRFVYNNYPDYINESIIKRRYTIVDWSKEK